VTWDKQQNIQVTHQKEKKKQKSLKLQHK